MANDIVPPFPASDVEMVEMWSLVAVAVMIASVAYPLLKKSLASVIITIGLFIVFAIEFAAISFSPFIWLSPPFYELAFSPSDLASGVGAYTIFTSIFLHASFTHIIFNALTLVFLGMMLENHIGAPRFIVVFLVSGVIGNLVYAVANLGQFSSAVGASGAISGILGALVALYPRERVNFFLVFIPLRDTPMWVIALLFLALQMIFVMDSSSNVAWQAHIGGLLAGLIVAPLIMRIKPLERRVHGEMTDIMLFANTPKEREIASRIKSESLQNIKEIWLEELAKTAKCPQCHRPMRVSHGGLKCESGHKYRI